MRTRPDTALEEAARAEGFLRVAGVDEAGRGPIAGPLVAAAVILDPGAVPDGLDDSKRLSPARRAILREKIERTARWGVGVVDVATIDRVNVLQATFIAMREAMGDLLADLALIDGTMVPPGLNVPARAVVRGDARSASIAAASILAKELRDSMMRALAQQDPRFNWGKNKGYLTPEHRSALAQHGPTQHHRRTFAPVRDMLCPPGG
ncbi:RNase HII [Hasllibacter halocynthiae]|uniref:Ribonuclease HII n=1 Tax=Hasllibacter halocynthiae TaxID=595589 RepID=A0A2T0X1N7_9RHOB|nr:ribonuclease HII [Hasllibacter halocynthiae]PRY92805.1 RNase HII [Hasllibacter halocynthiae]